MVESYRSIIKEELARLDEMRTQVHALSSSPSPASAIVDKKANKLSDIGANILVREDGTAAISDFGLTLVVGIMSTTSSGFQRGTQNWASSEQLTTNDARTLTPMTDTWSFGMTILELLTDRELLSDTMDIQNAIVTGDIVPHIPSDREQFTPADIAALLGYSSRRIDGVIAALGHVLTKDNDGRVSLKDDDFAENLGDPRRCMDRRFLIDKKKANLHIAAFCLELLVRELHSNMCAFQNATTATRRMANLSAAERSKLKAIIPAPVAYAARFWALHINHGNVTNTLLD
ncbi:hypothetical protein HK405_008494 [Cladochytrium tenue]|nr:hypothetical protein HK405_008494 [Cladochytrium tenue]